MSIRIHSPDGASWCVKRSKRICSVPIRRYTDDTKTQYTLMVCAKLNKPHHTYYTLDVKRPNELVLPQPTKLERETFETLEEKFPIPATKYLHCKQRLRLELHSKQMEVFQRRRGEFANQVRREMEKKKRQQSISRPVVSFPKETIEDIRCNQTVKDAAPQSKARALVVSQDDIAIINALLQAIYFAPRCLVPCNDKNQLRLLHKGTEIMDLVILERHGNPYVHIAYMYTIYNMLLQFAILTYARMRYYGIGEAITCIAHKLFVDTRVHVVTGVQRLMPRRVQAIMFSPDNEDTDTEAMAVEVCERHVTPSVVTKYKMYLPTIYNMLVQFAILTFVHKRHHGIREAITCIADKFYVDTRAYMRTGVQSLMPRRVQANIMFSPDIGDPFNTDTEAMVVEVYEQHVTPYVLTEYKIYLQTTCIPNMLLEFFILTYARRYHGIKEAITCTSYKFYADTREENRESSQEIETSHNDLHDANIVAQVKWNLKQIHELREIAVENREHAPAFEGMDTTPDKYACDVTKPTIYNDDNDEGMFGGILGVYVR